MNDEELKDEELEDSSSSFERGYDFANNKVNDLVDFYNDYKQIKNNNSTNNQNNDSSQNSETKPNNENVNNSENVNNKENVTPNQSTENVNDLVMKDRLNSLKNGGNNITKESLKKAAKDIPVAQYVDAGLSVASAALSPNVDADGNELEGIDAVENKSEKIVNAGVNAAGNLATDAVIIAADIGTGGAAILANVAIKEAGSKASSQLANMVSKPISKIIGFATLALVIFLLLIASVLLSLSNIGNINKSESTARYDSEISLTRTNLTREEFIAACDKQSSHRDFYNHCGKIYDLSIQNNFNPEMVIIRARVEGFSPGASNNNYWGIGCVNLGGYKACHSYETFDKGVLAFIKNVSKYETVEKMAQSYAFIGHNWYNPGDWGNGGCVYFSSIKKYLSESRAATVANYCSVANYCKETACQPTNEEDQNAYAKWQVERMVEEGVAVFGKVTKDVASSTNVAKDVPNSVDDLKNRHYFTFDIDSYFKQERNQLFAQCVWYAYHRAMEIIDSSDLSAEEKTRRIESIKSRSGNGGVYVTNMDGAVFSKTTDPNNIEAPAVISWQYQGFGHVAIVEEVSVDSNGNKVYLISEGWRQQYLVNGKKIWISRNTISEMWGDTVFNKYTTSNVSKYGKSGVFVNAASLLK